MKFKVVGGYNTLRDRVLAMERGELAGNCGFNTGSLVSTVSEQYRQGKIRVLFQAGLSKDPRFADVPNVLDEAKTDADRRALEYMFATLELGRPFATAPETPADRVTLLRAAFDKAMKDPGLVAEAEKMKLGIDGMNGAETAAAVARLYETPRAVVERVQAALETTP
jgi:tripartite-type tricarboxylate transporter receptor subunit TctC